ncbi:HAD family hydrolase [Methanobrevibacter sp.]|uniref:HAD family hydrolase n=1 Tax=Methanobrevibacter sp. TaxID=66852 RepID=UPI00386F6A4A
MKRLAIFDFDGTLFDSIHDVLICFNRALAIHDFPALAREELIPCLGGNIDEIVSLVLKDNSTPQNVEAVKETYLDLYYSSEKELTVPFPKAHGLLRKLQDDGVILAINSNRLSDSLEHFVNRFFSDIDFVLIEGHNLVDPSKPHPWGVQKILKKAEVPPEDAIYIGDSNTDIATAKNAGIDCVVVKWGYGSENDWKNDYILESVDDMCEIPKYF